VINEQVGVAAPRIAEPDGSLDFSQRRFPRLRSTYARALFLHRLFPRASWTDEVVRDRAAYFARVSPDWVSGACLLVRRNVLEELDGWDEGFFMYCEDIDLCARVSKAGYSIQFEPRAIAEHEGGGSAPRPNLLPTLAESRMLYARKHLTPVGTLLERVGLALEALTHAMVSTRGPETRRGHARALRKVITGLRAV
jgi:N-acetylglucosaminyl-diphospho-decaprenol L-rhamnosyltransferase